MSLPIDATDAYAQQLRALWAAAGKPSAAAINRRAQDRIPPLSVPSATWHAWLNGDNVPAKDDIAHWLIEGCLRPLAKRTTPDFEAPSPVWWARARSAARAGRSRGGRPRTVHPPAASIEKPNLLQVGMVPPQAGSYQRRRVADLLEQAALADAESIQCQVLMGTGGVGKTQLAAAFARNARDRVEALVWVVASSTSAVIDIYADAAVKLGLAVRDHPERAARGFLEWAATTNRPWLVILDNVTELGTLRGWWPPAAATGQIVVTTRHRDLTPPGLRVRTVEVGIFAVEEARSYLESQLSGYVKDDTDRDTLIADMERLPLALAQAAAYMRQEGIGYSDYRQLLHERLLACAVPDAGDLPDDHQHIVSAAWDLSIEQADVARPKGIARPLLNLLSVLDADGVPTIALTSKPALDYLTTFMPDHAGIDEMGRLTASHSGATPETVNRALRTLHRYYLISHDRSDTHREARIHRLTQRAVREHLLIDGEDGFGPERFTALAETAADALLATWPRFGHDRLSRILRANTDALHTSTGPALWTSKAHPVLFRAAHSLGDTGQITAAADETQRLLALSHRHFGPGHRDTITARANLAVWRGEAGDAAGTVTALTEILADQLRVLGPDHPDLLATQMNLAVWQQRAGDLTTSAATSDAILTGFQPVLGPDHPAMLVTRAKLAYSRGYAGDAAGAVTALTEILADQRRVLGPDHPDTLDAHANLAVWHGRAGDPAGAAATLFELLDDFERVQGPDHPDTLMTINDVAFWLREAGDTASANAGFTELLARQLRVLGPEHPDTLITRVNLASGSTDTASAVTAFTEILSDQLRLLGPEHPDTLATRANLAVWHGRAGDPAGAAAALVKVLADQLRVLGPDHPTYLTTLNNLAACQGAAEDPAGAAATLAELLTHQTRLLGPDHPDTLVTQSDHAFWCGEAGDLIGAAAAFAELLTKFERTLGPDHPDTLATRSNLALMRGHAGDPAGAAATFAELLTHFERTLGPDHPKTLGIRSNFEIFRGLAGDPVGAAAAFAELLTHFERTLGPDHPDTRATRRYLELLRERAHDPGD